MLLMGRRRTQPRTAAHRRAGTAGVALLCAGALAFTSAQATPTAADPSKEKRKVDAQVEQLRELLDDTNQDLAAAYIALEETKGKLPAARTALAHAVSETLAADRANSVAAQELQAARASEDKAQEQLDTTTSQVSASRTRVAQFAAQVYQEQGFGQLDMALSRTDPSSSPTGSRSSTPSWTCRARRWSAWPPSRPASPPWRTTCPPYEQTRRRRRSRPRPPSDARQDARDTAAQAKADPTSSRRARPHRPAPSQTSVAGQGPARHDAGRAGTPQESSHPTRRGGTQAAAARRVAEARKAAADRAKKATSPRMSPRSGGDEAPRRASGYLSAPSSGRISSEFGQRFHPIYKYWKLHAGRDYAAPCGSPIRAAASGTIIMAGDGGGYGNRVVIDHGIVSGEGLATTYNHMQSIRKRSGTISRGEVLGYIGTTGTSTGCHLHFETLQNGDFVDPRRWL